MSDAALTIVIPALNEEAAIGDTISRCLAAREEIKATADLADVQIVVVSDGSTDRTVEIAEGFEEVRLIVFPTNRGYGAAIKRGWEIGDTGLLGFLDADGTCDPRYFAQMAQVIQEDSADVVLGSRLGPDSRMPPIRKFGNRVYAILLGFLCGRRVTDTASGMRVVRRSALKYLYPLPDGLHFTPSMSARAMLNNLRVVEIPMTYDERVGQSKLNVVRDGIRFLRTIISGVLCYRPEKIFLMMFVAAMAFIGVLSVYPLEYYWEHGIFEPWMLYRFVVCSLLGSFGLLLLLATALANRMADFGQRRSDAATFWPSLIASVLRGPALAVIMGLLLVLTVVILWPGIVEYVTTQKVYMDKSRLIAGAFTLFSLLQTMVFAILLKIVDIWKVQSAGGYRGADQTAGTARSGSTSASAQPVASVGESSPDE